MSFFFLLGRVELLSKRPRCYLFDTQTVFLDNTEYKATVNI